jgi:hypothetical protein
LHLLSWEFGIAAIFAVATLKDREFYREFSFLALTLEDLRSVA